MKRKIGIGFLVFIGAMLLLYFAFASRVYPVATVNDAIILASSFQSTAKSVEHYYQQIAAVSGGFASTTESQFISEMRRIALQALIEDELIVAKLRAMYEPDSLVAAVDSRVAAAFTTSTTTTEAAVRGLFGLTLDEFKGVILAPKARAELLKHELEAEYIDFDSWLTEALQTAQVSIVLNDLAWGDGQVELTGEQSYTAKVKDAFNQIASTTETLRAMEAASSTAR